MRRPSIVAVAVALACLAGASPARAAGSLTLAGDARWVVLAARQSLDEATDFARSQGREIQGVRVVRSGNGWFAVVAGPVAAATVPEARKALASAAYLPADLYLSRGEAYLETLWTAPPPAVLAGARYEGDVPVRLQREGLTAVLDSVPEGTGRVATLALRQGSQSLITARIDDNPSDRVLSFARFVRLDARSPHSQVVFGFYWGGAHCCTVTQVLTEMPGGGWVKVDAPVSDGEGYAFEDLDHDGQAELVDVDNSFLYAFDSYAGSFAPPALYNLQGAALREVTAEPRFRPYLQERLRRWEQLAEKSPELWRSNGFLAGWVAAKAQVGEVEAAWPRMLASFDRSPSFGPEECTTGQPADKCPPGLSRRIPFPDALRAHLLKHGYPVPASGDREAAASSSPSRTYAEAQAAFQQWPEWRRYELQMLLIAAGHTPAVSTDQFSHRLHDAILAFQAASGLPATGLVEGEQWTALRAAASPLLQAWGLKAVVHPVAGVRLWVPEAAAPSRSTTSSGLVFDRPDRSLRVSFDHFPGLGLPPAYHAVLSAAASGARVNFKVLRDDFFVVSTVRNDVTTYSRYHALRGGIVGFSLSWSPSDALHGERLATLMSDLFRANVGLGLDRSPPSPAMPVMTAAVPAPSAVPAVPQRPEDKGSKGGSSTGSGFFVTHEGHVLTNAHVVEGCSAVTMSFGEDQARPARVLARDATNDLAVLKTDFAPKDVAVLRTAIRQGEPVAAFGFPLTGLLSAGGNFTLGNVTALAGVRDDSRILQVSAPVQPGNSGGPLLDETGAVAGVVVAKLNALRLAAATDDIPQNVNFAIKAGVAAGFLESQSVAFSRAEAERPPLKPADLADRAKSFTGLIRCEK